MKGDNLQRLTLFYFNEPNNLNNNRRVALKDINYS